MAAIDNFSAIDTYRSTSSYKIYNRDIITSMVSIAKPSSENC